MLYAIIALVALAIACAVLVWRCAALRREVGRRRGLAQDLKQERGIRQNLQNLLDRREAEIQRLHRRLEDYESGWQEMENRASDLKVSLFRESGLRVLAEKEDGAKRLKLEQLETQLSEARRKLRRQQDESAEALRRMQDLISGQEKEIARLRQLNARRIRRSASDPALENQVTLDEVMGSSENGKAQDDITRGTAQ